MENLFAWPRLQLVQRLSMALTLCCCAYVVYFLLMGGRGNFTSLESKDVSLKDAQLVSPAVALDLKPYDASVSNLDRDIFSFSTAVSPSGATENTPKGQLPAHLKVVGLLIADKPQVVIEDTFAKKTYFIDEANPQAGIKMMRVNKDQMIINYRGEDIFLPIPKKSNDNGA